MPIPTPRTITFLANPLSRRVKRHASRVRTHGEAVAGKDGYCEASKPDAMADFLAPYTWGPDDLLCVAGGDGTIHGVLTALERQHPRGPWPRIAAAPGGTTNMTVKDFGPPLSLTAYLEALRGWLEAGRGAEPPTTAPPFAPLVGPAAGSGRFVSRPVVTVARPSAPPLAGMFFGAGAVSAGVDFFDRRLKPLGIPEAVGSPLAIARVLASLALGGHAIDAMAPEMEIRFEEEAASSRPTVFTLVSSLHRLIVGARAYWGTEEGPMHVTLVDKGARDIFRSIPRLARGEPGDRLTPERGWRSRNAHRITLAFDGPYIIDGELYRARAADGPLEISTLRSVDWWMP